MPRSTDCPNVGTRSGWLEVVDAISDALRFKAEHRDCVSFGNSRRERKGLRAVPNAQNIANDGWL